MGNRKVEFQLYDLYGVQIKDSGGFLVVCKTADPQKETLYDVDGASQANGLALTRGHATFYVVDTLASVDCYIMAPGGQFLVKKSVVPGSYDWRIDLQQREHVAKIPFDIADCTAGTEKDSGFDEPTGALFLLHGAGVITTTIDAGITVDIGTGEVNPADGGDADGFCSAVSVASATMVTDNGALLAGLGHYSAGDSITYTLSVGADTAGGFAILPYLLIA